MAQRSSLSLWLICLGLSLGPAVSNGFARFAYGLILPEMRTDLSWTYTEAGWINTANAIGYLIGALFALAFIARWGASFMFILGMALTALALITSALTADFIWLSVWRVVAGIGGAPVFIAGGVLASTLFAENKSKNALAIAVYFGGGGLGMIICGLALPYMVDWYGGAIWPLAWLLIGVLSYVAFLPSYWAAQASPAPPPAPKGAAERLPTSRMLTGLTCYFCFGLGYIVYVTFLIAWMRGQGASTALVAWTWAIMGLAVLLSPFIWSRVLAGAAGGRAMALTSLAVAIGILIPLVDATVVGVTASAIFVGGSFFMVPTASTAFIRKNLPALQWGGALSLFTVIFSIGQILGPTAGGYLADITGDNTAGLGAAGLVLFIGALFGAMQKPIAQKSAEPVG
ncbi:MAG: YbfB/YjiJ family MFS transporter [Pseudomonadota bacterium]